MVGQLAGVIYDKLTEAVDPDWITFAKLSRDYVYADESQVPQSVKDTIDAVFHGVAGTNRLMALKARMYHHVFQRLLPDSSAIPLMNDHELLPVIADIETAVVQDKDASIAFWQELLGKGDFKREQLLTWLRAKEAEVRAAASSSATATPTDTKIKKEGGDDSTAVPKVRRMSDLMTNIPGTDGTPTQFRVLLEYLQYRLSSRCPFGLWADIGLSKISESNGFLVVDTMPKQMHLNYYGSLTLTPQEGAIQIGSVFRAPLYLFNKFTSVTICNPWIIAGGA